MELTESQLLDRLNVLESLIKQLLLKNKQLQTQVDSLTRVVNSQTKVDEEVKQIRDSSHTDTHWRFLSDDQPTTDAKQYLKFIHALFQHNLSIDKDRISIETGLSLRSIDIISDTLLSLDDPKIFTADKTKTEWTCIYSTELEALAALQK